MCCMCSWFPKPIVCSPSVAAVMTRLTWHSPDLSPLGSQISLFQVHQMQPVRQKFCMRGAHVLRVLMERISHASAIAVASFHRLCAALRLSGSISIVNLYMTPA